jgi:hypothetical protein
VTVKVYVDVRLAGDDDATVERIRVQGTAEEAVFVRLATAIEAAVRDHATDVVVKRDAPEGTVVA